MIPAERLVGLSRLTPPAVDVEHRDVTSTDQWGLVLKTNSSLKHTIYNAVQKRKSNTFTIIA